MKNALGASISGGHVGRVECIRRLEHRIPPTPPTRRNIQRLLTFCGLMNCPSGSSRFANDATWISRLQRGIASGVLTRKYVWRRLVRNLDKQPKHYIEPRSVDAVIKVLSRGYKSDHKLMFDILRDICGLPQPSEDRPPPPPKVEPNMFILDEALDSCIMASRPEMAIHYAQIVIDSPELRPIIRVWHLRKIITAHLVLAKMGPPSPAHSESAATWVEWFMAQGHEDSVDIQYSLNTALETCHHCGDMPSALRIARAVLEGPTRGCSMPALAWVYLFRLAIVAPPDDKWQCLDLLTRHDSVLDVWEWGSAIKELPEKKVHVALASRILHLLRTPLALPDSAAGGLDASDVGKFETWSDIGRRAKLFLKTAQHRDYPFIRK
ncbi:hypothetical protein EDB92DRAFT_1812907 [Lactarius akahatsu]|uniref:Uncharacterized protein n=1 Tax=Lactarius akahatsu TaxID=416441 RepID=A0AAD4LTR7_9AGAM|nr:hypothetical protein EDB92DRAFT_1812907 [Lactarius akahatsu]